MATIKQSATLVKRVYMANLSAKDGLALTIMLNGPHGIGKTQIIKEAARQLGGSCYTMDGSVLKEGDAVGIPFPFKTEDGTQEVRFIKHHAVNKILRMEQYYYETASTVGLMDGKYKIEKDKEGNEYLIVDGVKRLVRSKIDIIESGEDNQYKILGLTPKEKQELVESGAIKPILLFIDEINRAEMQTAKELMNIILNRDVNGYKLPWFVSIVAAVNPSSQNSSYATTEFDPAQYSRFINVKVSAKLEDWIEYALEAGINPDVAEAITVSENIFTQKDSSTEDTTEMTPDPRAWEMVSHIINACEETNSSKFFSAEERKEVKEDIRKLVRGKVGETAARTFFANMENRENNIKPQDILTMKTRTLDKNIVEKFNRQKKLTQTIISSNLVNYLANNIDEISKWQTSSEAGKKEKYMNFMEQLKEFVNMLDSANQILFAKKVIKINNGKLFTKIGKAFSKDVLLNLNEAKIAIKNLQEN